MVWMMWVNQQKADVWCGCWQYMGDPAFKLDNGMDTLWVLFKKPWGKHALAFSHYSCGDI